MASKRAGFMNTMRRTDIEEMLAEKRKAVIEGKNGVLRRTGQKESSRKSTRVKKPRSDESTYSKEWHNFCRKEALRNVSPVFFSGCESVRGQWKNCEVSICQSDYEEWRTQSAQISTEEHQLQADDSSDSEILRFAETTLNSRKKALPAPNQHWTSLSIIALRCKGWPIKRIAECCRVTSGLVKTALRRFKQGGLGRLFAERRRQAGRVRLLGENHLAYIRHILRFHEGDVSLVELRDALRERFEELDGLSTTTVWRTLTKTMGYSFRKALCRSKRVLAVDREPHLKRHLQTIRKLEQAYDKYWSVDESAVWTSKGREHRWGKKGERLVYTEPDNNRKYTLLLAISSTGLYFGRLIDGGVTSIVYAEFVAALKVFDGSRKIAVWQDNAPIHRSKLVLATAHVLGISMHYTAPYFPEGNAVEYAFAFIKSGLTKALSFNKTELSQAINTRLASALDGMMTKLFYKARSETMLAIAKFK